MTNSHDLPKLSIARPKQPLHQGTHVDASALQGSYAGVPSGPEQRFPMTLGRRASIIDGQDTLVLNDPTDARTPWCWVTDELRWMPDGRILGMTFVDAPLISQMVFPFVLKPAKP